MSIVIIYDPLDTIVPNRVTTYLGSANTPSYSGNPNTLINPDLSAVSGVVLKYWKYDAGSIVEMTTPEKEDIDEAADSVARINSQGVYLPTNFYLDKATQGTTEDPAIIGTKDFIEIKLPRDCFVTSINCQLSDEIIASNIELYLSKNGSYTLVDELTSASGFMKNFLFDQGDYVYSAGDTIGIRTISGAGLAPNSTIEILFYIGVEYTG